MQEYAELLAPTSAYFIDPENVAEMARLSRLDTLMAQGMGGLFAPDEQVDLAQVHNILDIACGSGGWVQELAFNYPNLQVTGIDISRTMIQCAHTLAYLQGLDNAQFHVMDALQPLDFPDGSFDIVNARMIADFMPRDAWGTVLQEFVRVTRPGGIIRLTECDELVGATNSGALEKLSCLSAQAFYLSGRSLSPDPQGRHFGVTPMLARFLQQVGCQHIQQQLHMIDFSAGTQAHLSSCENFKVVAKLAQPFLSRMGMATVEELEELCLQMLADMMSEEFRGISYFLTVWGRKPI